MEKNKNSHGIIDEILEKPYKAENKLLKELKVKGINIDEKTKFDTKEYESEEEKTIRSELLKWLLTDPKASKCIPKNGLKLRDKIIVNDLNLEGLTIDYSLDFDDCTFKSNVNLNSARLGYLSFARATFKEGLQLISTRISGQLNCRGAEFNDGQQNYALIAQNAIIDGNVLMDKDKKDNDKIRCFKATGEINFYNIQIGGSLSLRGGLFVKGNNCYAIKAHNAIVKGDLLLDKNPSITGNLDFKHINIGGDLKLSGLSLKENMVNEIDLRYAQIGGSIFMNEGFNVNTCIKLKEAHIKGSFYCDGGKFSNPKGWAINGKRIIVEGDIMLDNCFRAFGEVKLCGARIGGQLKCEGGEFHQPDCVNNMESAPPNCALIAKGINVGAPVFLNGGFKAFGEVNFFNAFIKGDFNCSGGSFKNKDGVALNLEQIDIDGDLFFDSIPKPKCGAKTIFRAEGEINLNGASVDGKIQCSGGYFENTTGSKKAITAMGITIKGPLFMDDGFHAKGEVDITNAKIAAPVYCCGGLFENTNGNAINAERAVVQGDFTLEKSSVKSDKNSFIHVDGFIRLEKARIEKALVFNSISENSKCTLDLKNAYAHTLEDKEQVWKNINSLDINGFDYINIAYGSPYEAANRIEWLRLHNKNNQFSPQPYRTLASVLDNMGHTHEARSIRIEMNHELQKSKIALQRKIKLWVLGKLIDYGYNPFKVWKLALLIIFLGTVFFWFGKTLDIIHPTNIKLKLLENGFSQKYPHYPKFCPVIYSIDVFLPIVDLHKEESWRPDTTLPLYKYKYSYGGNAPYVAPINSIIRAYAYFLLFWMYTQIISGWVLTTMLLGGLTGLFQQK
ncbi:MAG: hypothetical protein GX654_19925 [Desulfatiglans sp.]|nr:hypothetical protein [Desulfatiglans sp.]